MPVFGTTGAGVLSTDGGKVTLSGTVKSWHDREEAEVTAWGAPGATSVVNDLAVVW